MPQVSGAVNVALRRLPVWPIYACTAAAAVWQFWRAINGDMGPDPVKALEHRYGLFALQFLVAGLAVTPLLHLTGVNLIRFRRALGVVAFCFAALHLLVWVALDVQFDWAEILRDIAKRPYVTVGMAAFVLLVPLAATSNDAALVRLGAAAWRRLHRLVYVAAPLAAAHFVMLGKTWEPEALAYLAATLILLLMRLPVLRRLSRRFRGPAPATRA